MPGAVLFSLIFLGVVVDAGAQSFYGGIRGTVRDSDGVVPGVELRLTHEEKTASRSSVTNALGEYSFTDVVPGPYTLRAVLAGYKTFERRTIIIATQDVLTF